MKAEKKTSQRAPRPDPKQAEAWSKIVAETHEDARQRPEAYARDTKVPAGGE